MTYILEQILVHGPVSRILGHEDERGLN
jgi:hypothetical protein